MNWLDSTRPFVLDPNELDLDDPNYHIPCFTGLTPLMRSIEKVGVINPPLFQEVRPGKMAPVLGRRRMMAAREVGLTAVKSRIVSPEMPIVDGFVLAFWDNVDRRSFDLASKAVVIRRLLELFPTSLVVKDFLPVLEIAPKGPLLESLRAIGGLEYTVLTALASGRIHEKSAETLSRLAVRDRTACMNLIVELGMNANKNAELISNLFDLCVIQQKSVEELLNAADAVAVLQDDELPRPARANRFRELARSWKCPELVRDERSFNQWRKGLSLPKEVTVRPVQSFEDSGCTIEVRAGSRDDAKRILDRLFGVA